MTPFGIKDALDIIIVAMLLYYLYKIMKESGTINIFFGVLAFIIVWVVASEIFEMRLIGTILDKVMSIGLIILVILFQDQIKRFLVELGNHNRWKFLRNLFRHHRPEPPHDDDRRKWGDAHRICLHVHVQVQNRRSHSYRTVNPFGKL